MLGIRCWSGPRRWCRAGTDVPVRYPHRRWRGCRSDRSSSVRASSPPTSRHPPPVWRRPGSRRQIGGTPAGGGGGTTGHPSNCLISCLPHGRMRASAPSSENQTLGRRSAGAMGAIAKAALCWAALSSLAWGDACRLGSDSPLSKATPPGPLRAVGPAGQSFRGDL
jgi:hypothetical protein